MISTTFSDPIILIPFLIAVGSIVRAMTLLFGGQALEIAGRAARLERAAASSVTLRNVTVLVAVAGAATIIATASIKGIFVRLLIAGFWLMAAATGFQFSRCLFRECSDAGVDVTDLNRKAQIVGLATCPSLGALALFLGAF